MHLFIYSLIHLFLITYFYSRIYPKGVRVDSSNFNPAPAWASGNQMVALNYQTNDLGYEVNCGKFSENGNCGYVLKPAYMLNPQAKRSPGIRMTIQIISAQQLPKPVNEKKGEVIDPFVKIFISDRNEDSIEFKTSTIHDNGFNPIWNEVSLTNVVFVLLILIIIIFCLFF
jgi:phosphatidylinositol phospholipase C delta